MEHASEWSGPERWSSAERAFAAFRRRGDTDALAAAFDATAPELLRVAGFLVPRDDVEDLLHDTFTVAIGRRADFDATRPLLPWLLGILANEARAARRRARMRQRERDARAPAAAPDPVAVASGREAELAFAAALRQLDRDAAALLRQHLVDELSCREIAERERRPAGTVRTQVSRAMAELRQRLPVGFAVAPGFGVVAPDALGAVRARVLAGAPTAVGVLWWLRPRAWLAFSGVAAAVVLVAIVLAGSAAPDDAPAAPLAAAGPEPARADLRGAVGEPAAAPGAEREPAAAPSGPPPWLLRGVVTDPDGAPIAGAVVCGWFEEMGRLLSQTRTDADGRYELDLSWWRDRPPLDRSGRGLFATASAPGCHRGSHAANLPVEPGDGAVVLEHDFRLPPYVTLRGRAVDRFGAPVPAAVLATDPGPGGQLHATGDAGSDGVFRLVLAEGVSRVELDVRDPEAGRQRIEVDVPAKGEGDVGDVVLQPGHRITGIVRLADGTPVPGATVDVRGGLEREGGLPKVTPDYWYYDAVTDDAGRFVANRGRLHEWTAWVEGLVGFDHEAARRQVAAERDAVEIVLEGVRLDLSWTDAEGRTLLPRPTRLVVFAPDDRAVAEAARAGDEGALRRAVADVWCDGPVAVVPCGTHVWARCEAAGRFGVDRLLTVPRRSGAVPLALPLARERSTSLAVRVRFADGGVPESFTCEVTPRAGASLHAFEETGRAPGLVRGRCAVGPVTVEVSAYPDRFDEVVERRAMVAAADRDNELDVVIARRGRIRFVLRDASAPDRFDDDVDGDVRIGAVRAGRFFWFADDYEYWGTPPLGRPVESMAMVPVGRCDVRFVFDGFAPVTVPFTVVEGDAEVVTVWLQPE